VPNYRHSDCPPIGIANCVKVLREWKKVFDVLLEELHISLNVIPTQKMGHNLRWWRISNLEKSEYIGSYSPNTPQNIFIDPRLTAVSNDSVTTLQFPIQQSVDGTIDWLRETKIHEFRICLTLPNILGTVTSIEARRVITPLKFVKQLPAYIAWHWIKRSIFLPHINYYFPFHPTLTCLFHYALLRQLVARCLYVDVRLKSWIFDSSSYWRLSIMLSLCSQLQFTSIFIYSLPDDE
jgi:hypothetical protein